MQRLVSSRFGGLLRHAAEPRGATGGVGAARAGVTEPFARAFAKPKKSKKGDGGADRGAGAASPLPKGWDALNPYKEGSPPEELPIEQYPDWVPKLVDRHPPTAELLQFATLLYLEGGAKAVVDGMEPEMWSVLCRRMSRAKIKAHNQRKKTEFS